MGHKAINCGRKSYPLYYKAGEGEKFNGTNTLKHYVVKGDGKIEALYTPKKPGRVSVNTKSTEEVKKECHKVWKKDDEVTQLANDIMEDLLKNYNLKKTRFPCNGEVITELRMNPSFNFRGQEIACVCMDKGLESNELFAVGTSHIDEEDIVDVPVIKIKCQKMNEEWTPGEDYMKLFEYIEEHGRKDDEGSTKYKHKKTTSI